MASAFRGLRLARHVQSLGRRTPASRWTQAPMAVAGPRRYATATPRPATDEKPATQAEQGSEDLTTVGEDPNMNGNYPDPSLNSALPVKRQFRDPYGDWWDKQERRNYGEPVHEVRTLTVALVYSRLTDHRTMICSASSRRRNTHTSRRHGAPCKLSVNQEMVRCTDMTDDTLGDICRRFPHACRRHLQSLPRQTIFPAIFPRGPRSRARRTWSASCSQRGRWR